jgi:iron uptake system component EfeO
MLGRNAMKNLLFLPLTTILLSCSANAPTGEKSDAAYQTEAVQNMHDALLGDLQKLHEAARAIQDAAPTPSGRGWDAKEDAKALAAMTQAWIDARSAYERCEGALAPLFPDIDVAIDARYDDFLEQLGPTGDPDPFDGKGVIGMHAIERILFAPSIKPFVIAIEASLPGYSAAAWPATEEQALEFKQQLCGQLVADTAELQNDWQPQRIDLDGAFHGLIALVNEQREKVIKAASAEEESRYAGRTMADLRDNLLGSRKIYELFQPWLVTKPDGAEINRDIEAALAKLDDAYAEVDGDDIPEPPQGFSAEKPSAADLQTPFGKLNAAVQASVDPNRRGSAVESMQRAAVALGLPEQHSGG